MTDRRGAPLCGALRRSAALCGAIPAAAGPNCRPSDSPKTLKENPSLRFREKRELGEAERILTTHGVAARSSAESAAQPYELQTRLLVYQAEWTKKEALMKGQLGLSGKLRLEISLMKGQARSVADARRGTSCWCQACSRLQQQ